MSSSSSGLVDNVKIARAVRRFEPHWTALSPVRRELAEKIVRWTELSGGRTAASKAMGVAPTTLDNYRAGKTQPGFLEVLRLARAAGIPANEVVSGDTAISALLDSAENHPAR